MKRAWFQDNNGTFYRNCPLILAEQERCTRLPWRYRRFWKLNAEWREAFRKGVLRKDRLGRGDVLVQPVPFRKAYPDKPGLWVLDNTERNPR
jgi:hypothetical protein